MQLMLNLASLAIQRAAPQERSARAPFIQTIQYAASAMGVAVGHVLGGQADPVIDAALKDVKQTIEATEASKMLANIAALEKAMKANAKFAYVVPTPKIGANGGRPATTAPAANVAEK